MADGNNNGSDSKKNPTPSYPAPTASPATGAKAGGFFNNAKNNFNNSTRTMKFVKGSTVVGSAMLALSGAKDIIAPERDETGERKDSVWTQVAKIGAAAALTYAAVGRNPAAIAR